MVYNKMMITQICPWSTIHSCILILHQFFSPRFSQVVSMHSHFHSSLQLSQISSFGRSVLFWDTEMDLLNQQCLCACVHTHTHTHTHARARPLSLSLFLPALPPISPSMEQLSLRSVSFGHIKRFPDSQDTHTHVHTLSLPLPTSQSRTVKFFQIH